MTTTEPEHGHPESTSTRPERNADCRKCGGRIRHYPPPSGVGPGAWAHLGREWLKDPHDPEPTDEALDAAQVDQGEDAGD